MIVRSFKRKLFSLLLSLISLGFVLTCTQLGLRILLQIVQVLAPGHLALVHVDGNLWHGFKLYDLVYQQGPLQFHVQEISLTPDWSKLTHTKRLGLKLQLTQLKQQLGSPQLGIKKASAAFDVDLRFHDTFDFQLTQVTGLLEGQELRISKLAGSLIRGQLGTLTGGLNWGQHCLDFEPVAVDPTIHWRYHSRDKQNPSVLSGDFQHLSRQVLSGRLQTGTLYLPGTPAWQLQQVAHFKLSPEQLSLDRLFWRQGSHQAQGQASWTPKTGLTAQLALDGDLHNLKDLMPQDLILDGLYKGQLRLHALPGQALQGQGRLTLEPGRLLQNKAQEPSHWSYRGGVLELDLQKKLVATLQLEGPQQSLIKGQFSIDNAQDFQSLKNQALQGQAQISLDNLAWLSELSPELSHVRGQIDGSITLSGTLEKPEWQVLAELKNGTALVQKSGLLLEHLTVHLQQEKNIWQLNGSAQSGSGRLELLGFWDQKNQAPPSLDIKGQDFQLMNTKTYKIKANPNIHMRFSVPERKIDIEGEVLIPMAEINLEDAQQQAVTTEDVVFTEELKNDKTQAWTIQPNVFLRLENNVVFKKKGLQALIGGKIQLEQYAHGFLFGSGRLTIKEGKYRLGGRPFYIYHGRLLYQTQTLLTNPTLDIRLTPKPRSQMLPGEVDAMGLSVQGTVNNPIIEAFSTTGLSQEEVLQRLGLAGEMTAFAEATGGGASVLEKIQDKLGIDEFNIDRQGGKTVLPGSPQPIGQTTENKTTVTVKKRLSRRFRIELEQSLQHQQDTTENTTKAKLHYSLNPSWTLSLEAGTEGEGFDLSYSTEKD